MAYVDIGGVRFEREFVIICDCKRQPQVAGEPSPALTGVRVILRWDGEEEVGRQNVFAGECSICGDEYRMQVDVRWKVGEARAALEAAAAP